MNAEAKAQLYDILIALGQQILDHYNPCDWKNGKCRTIRSSKREKGCCAACEHLGAKGCTVQSLACKLWLCEDLQDVFRECEAELKILRQVSNYSSIPYEMRRSKEENFTLNKFLPFP